MSEASPMEREVARMASRAGAGHGLTVDDVRLAAGLRWGLRNALVILTRALADLDLTTLQYHCLLAIGAAGDMGIAQGGLPDLLSCSGTRVSLLLRRMGERGLIESSRMVADRRQVRVRMTETGWRTLYGAMASQRRAAREMTAQLPMAEVVSMLEFGLRTYLGPEFEVRLRSH